MGLVHLDITPNNLMLHQGQLVVIDWGLAIACSASYVAEANQRFHESEASSSQSEGSKSLPVCGTPGYISPEILNGTATTCSPDIYSAGVVLGQWLELYLPGIGLHYLGSKLVRPPTTSFIIKRIQDKLEQQRLNMENRWPPILGYASDLLTKMLDPEPRTRITAAGMLGHAFLCAPDEEFDGFEYETVQKNLLCQSIMGKTVNRKDPIFFYRG